MEEIQYYSQLKEEEDDDEYRLTDSDMAAAQQLMQLSDDINSSISTKIMKEEKSSATDFEKDDEVDQVFYQSLENMDDYVSDGLISSSSIRRILTRATAEINEEIFGTDFQDDEVCDVDDHQPNKLPLKIKKRRYRFLSSIYRETKPIDDEDVDNSNHSKKLKKKREDDDDDDRRRHQEEVLLMKKKTLKGLVI